MSTPPRPPGRLLPKNNQCPSGENVGALSYPDVLMLGPRFCGVPQGVSTLVLCDTQMSKLPNPFGLSDMKYKLKLFLEIAGRCSLYFELTKGPRLTGGPQSENLSASTKRVH